MLQGLIFLEPWILYFYLIIRLSKHVCLFFSYSRPQTFNPQTSPNCSCSKWRAWFPQPWVQVTEIWSPCTLPLLQQRHYNLSLPADPTRGSSCKILARFFYRGLASGRRTEDTFNQHLWPCPLTSQPCLLSRMPWQVLNLPKNRRWWATCAASLLFRWTC